MSSSHGIREYDHVASGSESTASLLHHEPLASTSASTYPPASQASSAGAFAGLSVVVTSCSTLIGQAVVFALSAQGANIAITDPSRGAGQELCRELQKAGHAGSLIFAAIEVRDTDKLANFIRSAGKTFKKLDGLVNCATWAPEETGMHRAKATDVADIFDYNVRTTWIAMQAAIGQFEYQNDYKIKPPPQGYSVVNVVSSFDFNDHYAAYATAQQGVIGMTRSTAMEYAHNDIRINAISAGAIEEKDALQSLLNQFMHSTNITKNQIPMKRFATPAEIANVVLFLLGPSSSYITGTCIPVDGGISARRA